MRADGLRGVDDLLVRRVRLAEGDVLADRAGEEEALLRHDPELAAQRLLRDVVEVVPVDRDPARARVVEAREQLRDRRLARAGVADERDRRARRNVERDAVEHLGAFVPVAEAHVLEADVARRCCGSSTGARPVEHLRLLVQHLDDLVERGDRREERVVELRELLHRVEEVRQVADEREERADGHVPVEDEVAAVAEHDRRRHGREEVDEREVEAVEHDRALVRRRGSCMLTSRKFRSFDGLARERLHDAHAGDVLRERRGDEAEPLAHGAVRAGRVLPEERRRDDQQRQDRHRREREPPVEEEEDDRRADEGQRVLDEARDAVRDELVERLDVVREPADDHAGAVPLVEAEREPLEVAEERVAQVGEDALARPAGEVRLRGRRLRSCRGRRRRRARRSSTGPAGRCARMPLSIASFARYGGASEIARGEQERADRERRARLVRLRQPCERATRRAVARHDQSSTSAPRCMVRWPPGW